MRALLAWVSLVVVFDLGVFVALRDVIQAAPVSADVSARPTPDVCNDPSLSNVLVTMKTEDLERLCVTAVPGHAALDPTLQSTTCDHARVQVDPKTLDQMCDLVSLACDQQTYARMCPPLSDPERDGN